jgi:hypothetical protein
MTATTGQVLAAITRAARAADALRAARTAMTRDGGNENAPTWAAYLAALANHDAATAALTAARDSRWDDDADDDADDCPACNGHGAFPSRSGGNACECCEGTGTNTGCDCPGCHAHRVTG